METIKDMCDRYPRQVWRPLGTGVVKDVDNNRDRDSKIRCCDYQEQVWILWHRCGHGLGGVW